jgi:hypothetical protein
MSAEAIAFDPRLAAPWDFETGSHFVSINAFSECFLISSLLPSASMAKHGRRCLG